MLQSHYQGLFFVCLVLLQPLDANSLEPSAMKLLIIILQIITTESVIFTLFAFYSR
jgi:hypothetical protein